MECCQNQALVEQLMESLVPKLLQAPIAGGLAGTRTEVLENSARDPWQVFRKPLQVPRAARHRVVQDQRLLKHFTLTPLPHERTDFLAPDEHLELKAQVQRLLERRDPALVSADRSAQLDLQDVALEVRSKMQRTLHPIVDRRVPPRDGAERHVARAVQRPVLVGNAAVGPIPPSSTLQTHQEGLYA